MKYKLVSLSETPIVDLPEYVIVDLEKDYNRRKENIQKSIAKGFKDNAGLSEAEAYGMNFAMLSVGYNFVEVE